MLCKLTSWHALFIAAMLVPFLAFVLKPPSFAFYMFGPAPAPLLLDQLRLVLANALLVLSAIAGGSVAVRSAVLAFHRRRLRFLAASFLVLFHPLLQLVYFEALDTRMNYRWYDRACACRLLGQSESAVVRCLGTPAFRAPYGSGTLWEYNPLPFYWFGSRGQVFFTRGIVSSIDPNDD